VANQSFSADIEVKVDGSPLPPDLVMLLTEAYVEDSRAVPDAFELRFARNVLERAGLTIGTEVTLSVRTSDTPQPIVLMVGEVVAVEADWTAGGSSAVVRGLDHAHRLFHRRVAAYPELSVAEVVRQVAQRAGLQVGQVDDVPDLAGDPDTQLSQDGETDWAFLQRLAMLSGAQCAVVEGKLEFRVPEPPDGAPDASARAQEDPLVLEMGSNLLTLSAGVSAVGQPANVEVRGWDFEAKEAVVGTAPIATTAAQVEAYPPDLLASTFSAPDLVTADFPVRTTAAASVVAEAYADRVAAGAVTCVGVARGNPQLRVGAKVRLANVGAPFDMTGVLSRSRHRFSPHETHWYTTEFEVGGGSDRSLVGVFGAGTGVASTGSNWSGLRAGGLFIAEVADVNDPLKLGRVRLRLPWLSDDYTSGWARTLHIGAGNDRGVFWLPEVGDEVVCGCDRSDFNSMVVLGGLYNGVDKPPPLDAEPIDGNSGAIVRRALRTKAGHQIVFAESPNGVDEIRLETGDTKYKVVLDKKGTEILVDSDGKVTVKAKQGILIDAGTGPLEMKGQTVEIKGATSVKLSTQAGASVELAAAGTTVKGKPIQLN
jgi:phage protein D/phage baseplate assembly protein gpV